MFRGAIRIVNPEDWQVGAVVRALEGVAMLGVGGKKTAGYGALKVEIGSLALTRFEKGAWHEDTLDKGPFLAAFAERFGA